MAGKSPVTADEEQRSALITLSRSRDRGEADRARAILLTLSGWTSSRIAEAFGVREDTVRFWRSTFITGGVEALKTSVAPGPAPVKAERALAVAEGGLSAPGAGAGRRPAGGGRGGPVRAGGRSPEMDAAVSGGRDRDALRGADLALA